MRREFTAVYKKTRKNYVAWVEEIPGVNTQGKTLNEAKENLEDALLLMLDHLRAESRKKTGVRRESFVLKYPA